MKSNKMKTAGIVLAAILTMASVPGTPVLASEMEEESSSASDVSAEAPSMEEPVAVEEQESQNEVLPDSEEAESESEEEITLATSVASEVVVSTEQELIDAVDASSTDAQSRTKIVLSQNITVSNKLIIPADHYIELCGMQSACQLGTKKKFADSALNPAGVILVKGDVLVHDLEISGSNLMRAVAVYDGVLTLDDGAVITDGKITEHMNGSGIYISDNTRTEKQASLTINDGAVIRDNVFQPTQQAASVSMEGIGIYADQALVTMNGGEISGNLDNTSPERRERTATGGGVAINGSKASFVMNGGVIENNKVKGNGGAFYTSNGAYVVINAGTIRNNMCYGVGGAFYLTSSLTDYANLQIKGGTISGNIADATNSAEDTGHSHIGSGGAVFVATTASMEMTGGTLESNQAIALPISDTNGFDGGQGGAIYTAGNVTISGGSITNNTATAAKTEGYKTGNGGGIAVSGGSEPGTVLITGGIIQNNTATMNGDDVYMNADKSTSNLMSNTVYTILKTEGQGTLQLEGAPVIGNLYLPANTEFYLTGGINSAEIGVETEAKEIGSVIGRGDGYTILAEDARNLQNEAGENVYNLENGSIVLAGERSYTDLSQAKIELINDQVYSGSEITPEPDVVLDGETLRAGVDYQYLYTNNTDAGEAGLIVSGAGDYSGRTETSFTILPKNLNDITVGTVYGYPYSGEAVIPELNLSYGGMQLEKDTDYRMNCRNNESVGTGSADLTGIGNYTGSVTIPFAILSPDDMTICEDEESLIKAVADARGTEADPADIYISGMISLNSTLQIPAEKYIRLIGINGAAGLQGDVFDETENETDNPLIPETAGINKTSMIRVNGNLSVARLTLRPTAYSSARKVRQRVLRVDEGGSLQLDEGCFVIGGYGYAGSGIYSQGDIEINGAYFVSNRLTAMTNGLGGAIANDQSGTLTINSGTFTDNLSRKGAAVYNAGGAKAVIAGGVFRNNKASFDQGSSVVLTGEGTVVYNDSESIVEISGGNFYENTADDYGGALANYGEMRITGGTFSENIAGKKGAGIYSAGNTTLNNGVIEKNSIDSSSISFEMADGGGVYVEKGTFTMNGGVIADNTVRNTYNSLDTYSNAGNGGGVYVSNNEAGSTFIMHGGMISGNTARSYLKKAVMGHGGGVYVAGGEGKASDWKCKPGTFVMDGGTITNNTASGSGDGVYASAVCSYNYEENNHTYTGTVEGASVLTIGKEAVIDNNTADNLYLERGVIIHMPDALTGMLVLSAEQDSDTDIVNGNDYLLTQEDADHIRNEGGHRIVTLEPERNVIYLKAISLKENYNLTTTEKIFMYTGENVCPEICVSEKENEEHILTEGKDYTVTYTDEDGAAHTANATETGGSPYLITVTGCGEYAGVLTKTYRVQPASITLAEVNIPDQHYTGKEIRYVPTLGDVLYQDKRLTRNVDFYIVANSYRSNINPGTASFQIMGSRDHNGNGTGNFAGTRTVYFKITAANEWIKYSSGWRYVDADGNFVKSKWIKDNGEWYYLKSDGYMAANEWAKDGTGWMWMNGSGKITRNKWIQDNGEWYYLKSNGYMAANEWAKDSTGWMWMSGSGKITRSKWIKDKGAWYYLKSNGYMAANEWAKDSKYTYWMGSNGKIVYIKQ